MWYIITYYTPRFNEVDWGVYWYHLVRPSVCPSMDRIVTALYLQQYSSDPFHICTSYQATSEGVPRVIFLFVTLTLSSFDLGSNRPNGMGNHEAAGVSSERRRSSCSSLSYWGHLMNICICKLGILPSLHFCVIGIKIYIWLLTWYTIISRWWHILKSEYYTII